MVRRGGTPGGWQRSRLEMCIRDRCGRYHQAKKIGGQWYDCIQMELFAEQFESRWVKPAVSRRQVKA